MKQLLLLIMLVPTVAGAQAPGTDAVDPPVAGESPPPTRELSMVEQLTLSARAAARDGQCQTSIVLGQRVQQLDPAYFAQVFAVDPEITNCAAAPGMVPPSMAAQRVPIVEVPYGSYKDPTTALLLSLGVTVGGYALIGLAHANSSSASNGLVTAGAIAAFAGPTVGHTYAGDTWNAGLGVRVAGAGIAIAGLLTALSSSCWFGDDDSNCGNSTGESVGVVMLWGGAILYVGGTIYEIATAGDAARKYNHEHHLDAKLTFAPIQARSGTAPGMALVGRF